MNDGHMTRPADRRRGAPPAGQRLTRATVITRATALIERVGLAAFSLRALATELNVRPAALYNHVAGLDDLLEAVTGRFVATFDLPADEQPWPAWIATTATGLRARMLARPELTDLLLARAPATTAGPAFLHRFLNHLQAAGVSRAVAHVAWHAVMIVVIGSVQQERARNRDHGDTFEAVLAIALDGITAAATQPPDNHAIALLANHLGEHT